MSHSRIRVDRFVRRSLAPLALAAAFALPAAPAAAKSVLLPWIAQTRGVLAQSSDLYVHNPGRAPLAVRFALVPPGGGAPIACAGRTVEPGATAAVADARRRLCGDAAATGMLVASFDDGAEAPVLAAFDSLVTPAGGRILRTAPSLDEAGAAQPGQTQHLAGLRQDGNGRTALWLLNPAATPGEFDLVYRSLDGTELGTTTGVRLGAGKLRQISPSQHPLPAAGASGGFTVEIAVRSGAVLAVGIVVDDLAAAPVVVEGETR